MSDILERHFDTAFAAPDGIKKLRELILTLAMQGKLVPQDPKDPPASELLKKIEVEKQRLVKEGKIKNSEPLPEIKPEEVPYELPKGWEWVRLGSFLKMINGRAFKPTEWIDLGLPIVRIQNLNNPEARFNFCDESKVKEQHIINDNQFLISWSGTPGTSFGAFIWNRGKAALNQHIFQCFQLGAPFLDSFLMQAINNRLDLLISLAQGAVGLKHVTKSTLENVILPLPPLPEQHRIVAKIDQLMARCDELEKLREERERKRLAVHAAALKQLLDAQEKDSFTNAWQFLTRHFGELYTVKENVAELRKAILQLAVMGKLVPQDPTDPPASQLLKEIEEEKAKLVKSGMIKKSQPLSEIKLEEVLCSLPQGWEWVRLDSITSKITDGDHKTPPRIAKGYRLFSAKNVRDGHLDYVNCDYISEQHYKKSRERCLPETGDLLIVSVGGTIGRTSLVPDDASFALVRSVALIKPLFVNSFYLKYAMDSELLQASIHKRKRGGAQPCLYLSEIQQFPFSLPPLPEQRRIVAKVDQLMSLCDALEQQIEATAGKQTELLNAVMAQA